MLERGVPILRKAQEVIDYLKPSVFFIENPRTGRMKDFLKDVPFYDVDYCRYGFSYRKATRIWTDLENFEPRVCNKKCGAFENGRHLMLASGGTKSVKSKDKAAATRVIHDTGYRKHLCASYYSLSHRSSPTFEKSFVRSKEE
jgi:hypothetical protein